MDVVTTNEDVTIDARATDAATVVTNFAVDATGVTQFTVDATDGPTDGPTTITTTEDATTTSNASNAGKLVIYDTSVISQSRATI